MAAHDANDKISPPNKPSEELDLFDQLQDEFDALISGSEPHKTDKNINLEPGNELDSEPFNSLEKDSNSDESASTIPNMLEELLRASENKKNNDEPAPAMANMFEGSVNGKLPRDDLQEDFFASTTSEIADDSLSTEATEDNTPKESTLTETSSPGKPADKESPVLDGDMPNMDGLDPFLDETDESLPLPEEKAPIHPDMVNNNTAQRQRSGRFIALSCLIVLVVTTSIYWLVSPKDEKITPPNQQVLSNTSTVNSEKPPHSERIIPEYKSESRTVSDQPKVEQTTSKQAAEKAKAAQLLAAQAVKHASELFEEARHATTKTISHNTIEKSKAANLVAIQAVKRAAAAISEAKRIAVEETEAKRDEITIEKIKRDAAARQRSSKHPGKVKLNRSVVTQPLKQLTVIQPTSHKHKPPTPTGQSINIYGSLDDYAPLTSGATWVIELVTANSQKAIRQDIARMKAIGVAGKVVQVNNHGRIFHHILITGFASKMEATRRRDALAKQLGVRGAKVYKF